MGKKKKKRLSRREGWGFPRGRRKKNGKVAEKVGHDFGGLWVRALPWAFLGHSLSPHLGRSLLAILGPSVRCTSELRMLSGDHSRCLTLLLVTHLAGMALMGFGFELFIGRYLVAPCGRSLCALLTGPSIPRKVS